MKDNPVYPTINMGEQCNVHSKAYIQKSMDNAIKLFQAQEIEKTGENVTYSEALRRLVLAGLEKKFQHVTLTYDKEPVNVE